MPVVSVTERFGIVGQGQSVTGGCGCRAAGRLQSSRRPRARWQRRLCSVIRRATTFATAAERGERTEGREVPLPRRRDFRRMQARTACHMCIFGRDAPGPRPGKEYKAPRAAEEAARRTCSRCRSTMFFPRRRRVGVMQGEGEAEAGPAHDARPAARGPAPSVEAGGRSCRSRRVGRRDPASRQHPRRSGRAEAARAEVRRACARSPRTPSPRGRTACLRAPGRGASPAVAAVRHRPAVPRRDRPPQPGWTPNRIVRWIAI